MTIREFQKLNATRCYSEEACKAWGDTQDRNLRDWALCVAGEAGELCNAVKKLTLYTGLKSGDTKDVAKEACDVITYAILLLEYIGSDVQTELLEKFDEVSARIGWKR